MTNTALVTVSCPDRIGLVAAISGCLFDLGGNLGDTTFAVLGSVAEWISVVELPGGVDLETVETELRGLPALAQATVTCSPFAHEPVHGPAARVTHRITVSGGDRPGLVARLSEVFVEFGANIVDLNAERIPSAANVQYVVRIAVHLAERNAQTCLATVANTAGSLGLTCHWETA
jgi:glycine cleavage system transcriptional repressor